MTLATHIVIAEALAKPMIGIANPGLGFLFGMFTHYLADAIPHYDYHLGTAKQERAEVLHIELHPTSRNIAKDLLKITFDVAVGTAAGILVVRPELSFSGLLPYAAVAIGAILPDALQSVYWFWRKTPVKELKEFHDVWHAKTRLKWDLVGLGSQALVFAFSILLLSR
ncbi:MAG: hypothetical protein V4674_02155 [Patescibacteria group bacterium]